MMINETFDATNIPPQQSGGKHQIGNKWDFTIVNTAIEETANKEGGMFVITAQSPGGEIKNRYNIWNKSDQARRIAQGQLSALCHAIGIFQIQFATEGANIRGARFKGDIGFQSGQEPTAEKPEGGYVELKKVYDMNGNEPGAAGASQQQPQTTQQPNSGGQQWGGGAAQQQPNQPQTNQQPVNAAQGGGWQQNAAQGGGWQQNAGGAPANAAGTAPWKQG